MTTPAEADATEEAGGSAARSSATALLSQLAKLLSFVPMTLVLNAVARTVPADAYDVFGLDPEQVGLTDARILGQVLGVLAVVFGLLAVCALLARVQLWLVLATEQRWQGAAVMPLRDTILTTLAVVVPLTVFLVAPSLAPAGAARHVVRTVLGGATVGFWAVMSVPRGRRALAFVIGVALVGGAVAAMRLTGDARHLVSMEFFAVVVSGITIAALQEDPRRERARLTVIRCTPIALLVAVGLGASGTAQLLLLSAWLPLLLGWFPLAAIRSIVDTAWLDRVVPAWRTMATYLTLVVVTGIALAWISDRHDDAVREAVRIKSGLAPARVGVFEPFPIKARPVRLVPRTGDPLQLCSKNLVARLLGEDGDTVHVLLRPPKAGAPDEGHVWSLRLSDYYIVRGFSTPGLCEPLP